MGKRLDWLKGTFQELLERNKGKAQSSQSKSQSTKGLLKRASKKILELDALDEVALKKSSFDSSDLSKMIGAVKVSKELISRLESKLTNIKSKTTASKDNQLLKKIEKLESKKADLEFFQKRFYNRLKRAAISMSEAELSQLSPDVRRELNKLRDPRLDLMSSSQIGSQLGSQRSSYSQDFSEDGQLSRTSSYELGSDYSFESSSSTRSSSVQSLESLLESIDEAEIQITYDSLLPIQKLNAAKALQRRLRRLEQHYPNQLEKPVKVLDDLKKLANSTIKEIAPYVRPSERPSKDESDLINKIGEQYAILRDEMGNSPTVRLQAAKDLQRMLGEVSQDAMKSYYRKMVLDKSTEVIGALDRSVHNLMTSRASFDSSVHSHTKGSTVRRKQ